LTKIGAQVAARFIGLGGRNLAVFLSENGDIGPFRSILASLTAPLRRSIFREEFAQISWAELTKAIGVKDIGML